MKYRVYGYVTVSAFAEVEASTEQEAKEKFEDLSPPGLCHDCAGRGEGTEESGEVTLDGFDDGATATEVEECGD